MTKHAKGNQRVGRIRRTNKSGTESTTPKKPVRKRPKKGLRKR